MPLFPDTSEIPELKPVEPGEYDLRVIKAKETKSNRTGREGVMLICEIVGEDNAENTIDTMWLPMPTDDETKAQTMLRMIKERLLALGLPDDGTVELEDFTDLQFTALLDYEEQPNQRPRNNIKKII